MEQHGEAALPGQGHARDEELMWRKRENARPRKGRGFRMEAAVFCAKEQT